MKLAVVGTGFIGCSFARTAADHGLFTEVVGLDVNRARAQKALALGLIDAVVDRVPGDAAAVLLAPPCEVVASWVCDLADHPGVVFDVGSVKQPIVKAVRSRLQSLPPRYVPSHPVCGSERSGPEEAEIDLFHDQTVVLTPEPETDASATGVVQVMWRAVGARVRTMTVDEHDRILAVTSHLPHLLSFAFMNGVEPAMLSLAGGGFRDFTRIAASDAALWEQIFRLNKAPLMAALKAFRGEVRELETAIRREDTEAALALLESAAARRREFDGV